MAKNLPHHTLTEITLLSGTEFLHLEKRHKRRFDYPLHHHPELELNFIEHFQGIRRIIGDAVEDVTGDRELVLVGSGLEHRWEESESFVEQDTEEITIQFSPKLFEGYVFSHPYFQPFMQLLLHAQQGICFGQEAIASVLDELRELAKMSPGFFRFQKLMRLLYLLSEQTDYHLLSTAGFTNRNDIDDNQRITRVTQYIHDHFREPIRVETLARLAYMTPGSFSHFFKQHTHKSVSDFIIDERIGYAIRLLVEGHHSVLQVCYASGFQNVSNFNRQFLKRRGCTPSRFRETYLRAQQGDHVSPTEAELDETANKIYPKHVL